MKVMSYNVSLLAAAVTLATTTLVGTAYSANPISVQAKGAAVEATKAPLQGRLELTWGDARPGSKTPHRFSATVVDDAGRRHALDTDSALKAAGDLYSLNKSRVAVTLVPASTAVANRLTLYDITFILIILSEVM